MVLSNDCENPVNNRIGAMIKSKNYELSAEIVVLKQIMGTHKQEYKTDMARPADNGILIRKNGYSCSWSNFMRLIMNEIIR